MLSIGDFARLGQVSVRMLRHYDRIGLLVPARVDGVTGYRRYTADQLARLNRIIALKDLGFILDQVAQFLDDRPSVDELRGMLRLRRAELAVEHQQAQARLAGVEHRLRLIEKEHHMSEVEYVVKSLPGRRLAGRRARVGSQPEIGGVIGPMFGEVAAAVGAAGGCPETGVAVYESDGEEGMRLLAGYDYAGEAAPGFDVLTLDPVAEGVCAVHLGAMETIGESWQALARWIDDQGWSMNGPCREVYLRAWPLDDQSEWVTELQQPVARG